jgi:hypothetical protein
MEDAPFLDPEKEMISFAGFVTAPKSLQNGTVSTGGSSGAGEI